MKRPYVQYLGNLSFLVFTLALSASGLTAGNSVTAWGYNGDGQTNVPLGLTNVTAISAGWYHNLALKADGTVVTWGLNLSNQMNVPAGLNNVVAIAAGSEHSLALKADGTVVAWGQNNTGPAYIPPELQNVVAIAAGADHSLALKADGTVFAWGYNYSGQTNVPAGLANVVAISAGGWHNLALKADGTVVAWGYNYSGQTNVPAGLANVVGIAAGNWHNLALKADGTVVAWGATNTSQGMVPPNLSGVVAVSVGGYHNVVLKNDGTVVAWGENNQGQTNIPPGLSNIAMVAAGGLHSLALSANGPPILGNRLLSRTARLGTTVEFRVIAKGALPLNFQWRLNGTNLPGATNASLILSNVQPSAAGYYSLVVSNEFGVARSSEALLTLVPLFITSPPRSQQVLAGGVATFTVGVQTGAPVSYQWRCNGIDLPGATGISLVFTNTQLAQAGAYSVVVSNVYGSMTSAEAVLSVGLVTAWGYNYYVETNVPPGLSNAVAIAAGADHNLALKADGTVVAWGNNWYGQTNVPAGLTNMVAIAAGGSHCLALKANGTVAAWGYNANGQINVPFGLNNVVAIAAGTGHSLALKADGKIVGWGNNSSGQTNIPPGLENVVAIAAGDSHSLALRADGTVVAWGSNIYGQTNAPAGLSNVVAIAAGAYHNLALKNDGRLVAWGANAYGQAGIPTGLTNIIGMDAGFYHNLAVKADGAAVAWGRDSYGETVVPGELRNVVALAGGYYHSVALVGDGPPFLTEALPNRAVAYGMDVHFRAAVSGARPFSFQWRLNGTNLPGATNAVLSLTNVQPSQAGLYSVVVSNPFGTVTSSQAALTMTPLWITASPQSQTGLAGTMVNLSANAQSTLPITYQWLFNGQILPGETNRTLTLRNLQFSQSGAYSVRVSNAFGSVSSSTATVTIQQLLAWGDNSYGQTNIPSGLTNVVAIAAGAYDNFVLNRDGTALAWGYNNYGQINVPVGLEGVVAVSAGQIHSVALKQDGTILAWGDNTYGQLNVPADLTNVVAIAAGGSYSLALQADGRVFAWGNDGWLQTNVPAGLSNIVAIAAGGIHSLALKGDGRVVAWGRNDYGETNVPSGLTNVVAIAAGWGHSLALKADGIVVAWGRNYEAQTYVPMGLSNVQAISAGSYHSLALKADGTMVGWGYNGYGQSSVPMGVSNIVAIAGGYSHTLALAGSGPPFITTPLVNRTAVAGFGAPFYILATGSRPLSYQWRLNGTNLPGATNMILQRADAQAGGWYSVLVSNAYGTALSGEALLTLIPLQILAQPQSQTNWLYGTARFSVSVESSVPVSYQWRYGGLELSDGLRVSGARTAWLTISDLQFADAGGYSVVASNAFGVVTSQVAQLVITNSLPSLVCQPYSQEVDAGANTYFSVCVASHLPYSIQWFHNGEAVPGATSDNLQLQNVWTTDAGNYWCVVSNRAGMVTSAVAYLTVSLRSPDIFSPPSALTIDAGMDACFDVSVDGAPPPSLQWQFNDQDIPGATNPLYCISAVTSNNMGNYRVMASNVAGVAISAEVGLTVLYRPPAFIASPYSQSVLAGQWVTFSATVQGGPKPDLQWFFNSQPLAGARNPSLQFLTTTTNQTGDYWLVASNVFGVATSGVAHLDVLSTAPSFSTDPISRGVVAGDSVLFFANLSGNPPPSFQWQFNGEDIPRATNSSLLIRQANTNQTGNYVLVACNEGGCRTSKVARLLVSPVGPLDRWQWRQPLPQGNDLLCGAYGNGTFVLMGKAGARVRSIDNGVTWQSYNSGDAEISDLVYGNGLFVGVGGKWSASSWAGVIQTSPDGVHWTEYDLDLTESPRTVAYGNGRFVAAGYWNHLFTSTNGADWTRTNNIPSWLVKIRFGNGRFVALTISYNTIAHSTDGLNWTLQQLDAPGGLQDLTFGNGRFVLCGNQWTNNTYRSFALVSSDGLNWTNYTISPGNYFSRIISGSNLFMAMPYWDWMPFIATSANAVDWVVRETGITNYISGVAAGGGNVVGAGDKGAILITSNLGAWSVKSPGNALNLRAGARGNGVYVAVGNEGLFFTSTNRVDWARHQAPTTYNLRSIAFGNGRFVVVGDMATNQAVVLVSGNGLDWTGLENNINCGLYSITYGKGLFVAAGWSGAIATSPDGYMWTVQDSTTSARLNAITFNGDLFVAVGRNGAIVTSTNGLQWSSRYSGTTYFLQGVASGNGLLVAAGEFGTLATSTNAINWSAISGAQSPLEYAAVEDVQFANGQFLAVGGEGFIASSADGIIWTEHKAGCQNSLRNTFYAESCILAVGNNETILQSDFFGPSIMRVRTPLSEDGFEFSIDAEVGGTYRLQASDDLVHWQDVFTFSNTRVNTLFLDSEVDWHAHRFYRVVRP